MYSSPNRKCVSETRVAIGLRRDSFPVVSETVQGEAYRSRYPYFSNLVIARTIEATSAQENEWVRG